MSSLFGIGERYISDTPYRVRDGAGGFGFLLLLGIDPLAPPWDRPARPRFREFGAQALSRIGGRERAERIAWAVAASILTAACHMLKDGTSTRTSALTTSIDAPTRPRPRRLVARLQGLPTPSRSSRWPSEPSLVSC